ncbi:MAG: hypothetical protein ACLQF0_04475 [Dissulfurispiraceae bacterium]
MATETSIRIVKCEGEMPFAECAAMKQVVVCTRPAIERYEGDVLEDNEEIWAE